MEWNLFKTVEPHLSIKPTEISGRRLIKLHYSAKGEELPSPEQRKCLRAQSCPTLVTPWIIAHQVHLSMGFPRQEYWSGLPFPTPRDVLDSVQNLHLLSLLHSQAGSLLWHHLGSPYVSIPT